MVLMIGKAYARKASGLVAVTVIIGRLFIKVLCEGKGSTCRHWCLWRYGGTCRGSLSVCEDPHAGRSQEWGLR